MQATTTRLWLTLGLATALSTGCSQPSGPVSESSAALNEQPVQPAATVDFAKALEKLLAGEGGEGGAGMAYENGRLVISPLSGEQIRMAMPGNSFRRGQDIALDFRADGTFSGVEHPWVNRDAAVCEQAAGAEGYHVHEGQCQQRTEVSFPDGRWSVKGDQLCTTPALPQAAENLECTQVFVAIDRIALFSADGTMLSKGIELVKGPKS